MKLQIDNIILYPSEENSIEAISDFLERKFNLHYTGEIVITKRSLDARKKSNIHYRLRINIILSEEKANKFLRHKEISPVEEPDPEKPVSPAITGHVIVAGSGPAGLFAALRLLEAGIRVTLLERGKAVEERMKDITILEENGKLNTESNAVFGEGGAGTYSDGKLTARTRRRESIWFYNQMTKHGADPSIIYDAKPHIGTDRLTTIIQSIRKKILDSGGRFLFGEKVSDLIISGKEVKGVVTAGGREITADATILATGHSARDTYAMLNRHGVAMEPKGFAVGVRIEHPAELIRDIQYGNSPHRDILPPAEYSVTCNNPASRRGIYSFCMCPGGSVINSSSEEGHLCVNGMSLSRRDGSRSNAALVVSIHRDELTEKIFRGIELQRSIEAGAFTAGGDNYAAPAQRVTSFLEGITDATLPESTFRPALVPADIKSYLPPCIFKELLHALPVFDQKMKGFITREAVLIGAETRTSSPLRITRGKDFTSISHQNLYPAGEGAGYAGGIVSSAVDGIRAADAFIISRG